MERTGGAGALITLRAHHILCLQGFRGLGYDSVFTVNMARIHESITKNPDQTVQIVCGIDDICEPCPNHQGKICAKSADAEKNVQATDQKVLSFLDLPSHYVDSAKNIFVRANRILQTKHAAEEVCGACAWREKCLWYQSRA